MRISQFNDFFYKKRTTYNIFLQYGPDKEDLNHNKNQNESLPDLD